MNRCLEIRFVTHGNGRVKSDSTRLHFTKILCVIVKFIIIIIIISGEKMDGKDLIITHVKTINFQNSRQMSTTLEANDL